MTRPCPACGGGRARRAFSVRGQRFLRCGGCATLFLDPPPRDAHGMYEGEGYYANPEFDAPERGGYYGYKDYLADRERIEAKFARVLGRLERLVDSGRLLDVGAGPGLMVAAARGRGWDAAGVDPNPWAARYAREQVGVEVRHGELDGTPVPEGGYDALTFMDVLEHVAEPATMVACAAELVRPGGAVAVLTPDAGSPVSRLLGRRWPEAQRAPEHMVLFSAAGLTTLLGRHGLHAVERHSIGKESSLATLAADVAPLAPGPGRALARALERFGPARRSMELDPRTKFVLYAVRERT